MFLQIEMNIYIWKAYDIINSRVSTAGAIFVSVGNRMRFLVAKSISRRVASSISIGGLENDVANISNQIKSICAGIVRRNVCTYILLRHWELKREHARQYSVCVLDNMTDSLDEHFSAC